MNREPDFIKGGLYEVVRGKGMGTRGVLIWDGPDKFNHRNWRVGLKLESGEAIFVNGGAVEYIPTAAELNVIHEKALAEEAYRERGKFLKTLIAEKPVYGTHHGAAYGGDYECTVKILDPTATDEDLIEAVNRANPRTSSYGALRWSTGATKITVNRELMVVEYLDGYGMCD